jgi:replicative DNA helicase
MSKKHMEVIERPLPQSLDSERAVLGAILLDNRMLDTALETLKADHFFDSPHKKIFECMTALQEQRQAIDLITLSNTLQKDGELEACGGVGYVSALVDGVPKKSNVAHYAKIVTEKYALRQIIHTSHLMQEQAFEMHISAEEVLESSTRALVDLQAETSTDNDGFTERDAAIRMLENLEKKDGPRTHSGIRRFDEHTGGGRAGELWCYVAGTGVGKTNYCRQTAEETCKTGWHTLYASGEMYAHHLAARRVFPAADLNPSLARFPERISDAQRSELVQASAEQCQECRILDGEISLSRIRTAARKMATETKLGFVVADYDQLIDAPGKTPLDKQIALIRGMKSIAMENNCVAALVAQFRKFLAPGQTPTLEDVFGSKAAVAHPSVVLWVSTTFVPDIEAKEAPAELHLLKFRDGRTGDIPARFIIRRLKFVDVTPEEFTLYVQEKGTRKGRK